MIDIHCHLLPGVDDGPKNLDESLALCRIAVADGITHAISTPHIHPGRWDNDALIIQQSCLALSGVLQSAGVPLNLGYAAEVRVTDLIPQQIINREIPFYGEVDGFRVMLLEFPHGNIVPGSDKLVRWLVARQIRPLIAHPERNRLVMNDIAIALALVEAGCWLQITAGSVAGAFGAKARNAARRLLDEDVVAVIASDGHNSKARRPELSTAFDIVARLYGEHRADRLTRRTPARILAGQFPELKDIV